MKITVNIETNNPADLMLLGQALSGVAPAQPETPAARPTKPAAAPKPEPASTAAVTAPPAAQAAAAGAPTAENKATPDTSDAPVPTENDLISAANVAAGKAGNGAAAKIKAYIAANFTQADGSPGTLKQTAEGQRAALLDALQKIGRGDITL